MDRRKTPRFSVGGGAHASSYPTATEAIVREDGVLVGENQYLVVYQGPLLDALTWVVYGPPNPEGVRPVISTFKRYFDAITFACLLDNGSWGGNLPPVGEK